VAELRDEEGQAMTEYGLILALIAVVCIAILILLGTGVRDTFDAIVDEL
jgi:pilus assembly protein Flp/PilA